MEQGNFGTIIKNSSLCEDAGQFDPDT